jgi:hypothetical protein
MSERNQDETLTRHCNSSAYCAPLPGRLTALDRASQHMPYLCDAVRRSFSGTISGVSSSNLYLSGGLGRKCCRWSLIDRLGVLEALGGVGRLTNWQYETLPSTP